MSQPLQRDPAFQRSSFIQTCAYCGARFEIFVSRQRGNDEEEDYECPECGKGYSTLAALTPTVQLLVPRRDGKGDKYQETMF